MDPEEADNALVAAWDGASLVYDDIRTNVFEPRARILVRRAGISEGDQVLDLGTGTGIAAFVAREKVGSKGYVLGVDMSAGQVKVADEKAREAGFANLEFRLMGMASLDLPDESFDHVIGNYSLCCTARYQEALQEAYRVLRPGGKLTYNHEGPHPPLPLATYSEVFMKHRVANPSPRVAHYREANALMDGLWQGFKDPFTGLQELKAADFRDVEVAVTLERQVYPTLEDFLESKLRGAFEYLEMGEEEREALRSEVKEALEPMLSPEGLAFEVESLYLSGFK